MRQIVFDIETSGYNFDSLTESQQEYLLRYAEKEKDDLTKQQKIDDAIRYLSLYPFTAKIVAIGIYDVNKEKGYVYYESEKFEGWQNEEKKFHYKGIPEKEILESFWRIVKDVDQIITFNGRGFDAPFLMIRSAMLGVHPTKNLIGNRFDAKIHIDLLEQLTFYGLTRKFNLDFYCNAFGITSPKSKGVSGMDVKTLYDAGRTKDIAIYCGDDIYATYKLFQIWNEYLNFNK